MITKSEKNDFIYRVSYVKKVPVNDKITTKFLIKDYIRGLQNQKISYWVTVFDDIAIEDGDSVRLLDFDNLTASYYPEKKRITNFMSAVVEVIKKGSARDDTEPFNNPYESGGDD